MTGTLNITDSTVALQQKQQDHLTSAVDSTSTTTTSSTTAAVHIYPYDTPNSELLLLQKQYSTVKKVHVIRHAEGTHNINKHYHDMINLDARLTPRGQEQCLAQQIAQACSSDCNRNQEEDAARLADMRENADLIVTSPLTRCVQTALMCFGETILNRTNNNNNNKYSSSSPSSSTVILPPPKILAHESIRETVNFHCDRRRSITKIAQEFPNVDFSLIETDHDAIWEYYEQRLCYSHDGSDSTTYEDHRESAELYKVAERGRTFFQWLSSRPEAHVIVCSHSACLRCLWNYGCNDDDDNDMNGLIPSRVEQTLDDRSEQDRQEKHPVVQYMRSTNVENVNDKNKWEAQMRQDYQNCEIRSMIIAFP